MVNEIYIEDVRENPDLCEEMEKLLTCTYYGTEVDF